MTFFSGLCDCLTKRLRGGGGGGDEDAGGGEKSELFFELRTLQAATNCFSELNRLGVGGFGPVYRGLMPDGQEVAVKKLSLNSRQGVQQFVNEVKLLLKIQHKNLVTLLGCCAEGSEKMLVYEYLPNRSLDYFLFDKKKTSSLDWPKRFQIIIGVTRGLLYLHEEAPERIIHRDIKASNILLDERLNPKISDFGMARLFPGDDTHLNTFRISGTHGYMAPEYAMHGYLSVKTDVFSFGVLVLEIVSGRKNHNKLLGEEKADLLSYTWMLFQKGKAMEIVDPSLSNFIVDEVAMCIQLGLLCCQATVSERPDMNRVHLMLCSDSIDMPTPGKPGIQGRRGQWTSTAPSGFTNTNPGTSTNTAPSGFTNTNPGTSTNTYNGASKASVASSFIEDYSRNSISYSSLDEGR